MGLSGYHLLGKQLKWLQNVLSSSPTNVFVTENYLSSCLEAFLSRGTDRVTDRWADVLKTMTLDHRVPGAHLFNLSAIHRVACAAQLVANGR